MKIEDIRFPLHARPFVLHTADGRALPVSYPDFVFITLGGRTLIVNGWTDDEYTIVDTALVPRLEVSASDSMAAASESNQQP